MKKERKKRTNILARLYIEANDLLAEMERSAIAGLKKEANYKAPLHKREAGGKGGKDEREICRKRQRVSRKPRYVGVSILWKNHLPG